jgi:prepilin-type N-terminal cleavage/methylation domain-containing protein/prepilin-type processing-associated H-X9-DG protein
MKTHPSIKWKRGFTLVELLVVLTTLSILAVLVLTALDGRPLRAPRIQCVNNLKQIALAYRVWEGDHGNSYPMAVSQTNGGTREFTSGPVAFRHFQVMSNEIVAPKLLLCPAETDKHRFVAENFNINNSNISYFVGVDAMECYPQMILGGDHNLTNGTSIRNGAMVLTRNAPTGWTSEVHNKVGNILLADGSVWQDSISGLQQQIAGTAVATNWVQMPVLGP